MPKKILKKNVAFRTAALLLALLMFFSVPAAQRGGLSNAAAAGEDPVKYIRVGLCWNATAPMSADLQNERGGGFDFGYFDENRSFVSLCGTDENAISILFDWNMSRCEVHQQYEPGVTGSPVVGSWHILLDTCASDRDALEQAARYSDGFIAWMNGEWCVCAGSYTSEEDAEAAALNRDLNGTAMSGSTGCVTVVETRTGRILFEFEDDRGRSLGVMSRASGSAAPLTRFSGLVYYGGFQFTRATEGLTVVNYVTMDDYAACVTDAELGTGWPMEALKAQAIASKSYAAASLNHHEKYGFDVCGTTECQRYRGVDDDMADCEQAARETSGVYMTYQGEYALAFYCSCSGGATENSENVYTQAIPYLRGKQDPYESNLPSRYASWSFELTGDELAQFLRNSGRSCTTIVSVTPTYTENGNIAALGFTDANGKQVSVEKDDARTLIQQKGEKNTLSLHYTVTNAAAGAAEMSLRAFCVNGGDKLPDGKPVYALDGSGGIQELDLRGGVTVRTAEGSETISGTDPDAAESGTIRAERFRFAGSGFGHNVGMSQYGAISMAELGFTYDEILKFYYTGVQIG